MTNPIVSDFQNPKLTGPTTSLIITDNHRTRGHVIVWDDRRLLLKPSTNGYARFHVTSLPDLPDPAVGCVTALGGTVVAYVRAGDDRYGLWIAGVLHPDIYPGTARILHGDRLSGQWQNGNLMAVAVISSIQDGSPGRRWPFPAWGGRSE